MKTFKPILAALAMTIAMTAGAQTLKMEPQVTGVTTYEASTAVNLVVVKPEIQIIDIDPSILAVRTNGTERNVMSIYPCDARGAFNPEGPYLAFGLEKPAAGTSGLSIRNGVWNDEYSIEVGLKPDNNGGGTVAPQGHANIFEWMNAQVLTAPEVTGRNR